MTEPFVTMVLRLLVAALAHGVPVLMITAEAAFVVIPAHGEVAFPDQGTQREHVLLRLAEEEVREEIRSVIESDNTLTRLAPEMVGDADIHAACRAVAFEYRPRRGAWRCAIPSGAGRHPRGGTPPRHFRLIRVRCAGLLSSGRTAMPITDFVKTNFEKHWCKSRRVDGLRLRTLEFRRPCGRPASRSLP
ncbi:hypothetical protein [Azospirillum palustre]